jgi:signal transduction histidine kinase
MLQLFAIILLPLTLLVVGITFGSLAVHQRAMRSMVGERDERSVRIAADALNTQLDYRIKELKNIRLFLSTYSSQTIIDALDRVEYFASDFNAGIVVFSSGGNLLAISGNEQFWKAWIADTSSWELVFSELTTQTDGIIITRYPMDGDQLGMISTEMEGKYLIVGAFSITKLAGSTLSDLLSPGDQLSVLLVGANHQILFNAGNLTDQSGFHPGVDEALQGQSGIAYVKVGGDEHVTAYSPVNAAGWALITEESWEAVATPTLRTSLIAPLVLIPALLILLLALYLGASQVVKPLHTLESKAATLAWGDFKTIQEPVGGVAEIQHLQKELIQMANKVKEAQSSLHGYIGAITNAQEDERRRLARELHDDTLQALIALKQRVQLAQLGLQTSIKTASSEPTELDEIGSLTEQTIENLRRLTRDLRPIYLEDLGLVPALEMLAQETGQSMGITVEFQQQGNEIRFDASIELALYRIAQEALSNIARHARAKQASLSISFYPDKVSLQVSDDGIGFELPKSSAEYAAYGHYGLLGLQERAELIGASLNIRTSSGKGTHLTVTIPVQPHVPN